MSKLRRGVRKAYYHPPIPAGMYRKPWNRRSAYKGGLGYRKARGSFYLNRGAYYRNKR